MTLPRPHRDDVLLAAGSLALGLLLWSLGLHTQGGRWFSQPWQALVPLALMSVLEVVRRSWPQTALTAGTVLIVADQFTQGNLATVLMFADIVYAAVLYGTPAAARRIPVTTAVVTLAVTVGFLAWFRKPDALLIGLVTGLVSFFPAITGAIVRNHREAAETARLRAAQTALLAEMDRVQAVTAERARMARELHDMVANHLSAIAIHATAALSLEDPATTRRALGVIRENSVAGLDEMRRLIGLLRDGTGHEEPAAAPTLDGLDALVRGVAAHGTASGLTYRLEDRRDPAEKLPAPVGLAAYRLVQESLTNTLKHAGAGEVVVSLERTADALVVAVTSPGAHRSGPRAPGSGAGLVGMRERVALLGGTFEAGPVAAGDGPAPGPDHGAAPGGPAPGPDGGRGTRTGRAAATRPDPGAGPRPDGDAALASGPGGGPGDGSGKIWRVRAVLPVRDDGEPEA
ncbi:histidine kinase [Streptomyces sp. LP05-1]|uniref:histidine kinase n=1 Tax=Streptomyces pyxinae TaxID=2970734 RepID=A0ABT2C9Z3_9ACTN|nr:histidine kinase [Streptomyces sp. LP05-1]MCS0634218.1 histidine kinase [Streptomyces sp. LP05-1]